MSIYRYIIYILYLYICVCIYIQTERHVLVGVYLRYLCVCACCRISVHIFAVLVWMIQCFLSGRWTSMAVEWCSLTNLLTGHSTRQPDVYMYTHIYFLHIYIYMHACWQKVCLYTHLHTVVYIHRGIYICRDMYINTERAPVR